MTNLLDKDLAERLSHVESRTDAIVTDIQEIKKTLSEISTRLGQIGQWDWRTFAAIATLLVALISPMAWFGYSLAIQLHKHELLEIHPVAKRELKDLEKRVDEIWKTFELVPRDKKREQKEENVHGK